MKKETLLTVMAIAIMISSNSCSDWQNLATTEFGNENLQKACENSKGTYNSDSKRCVCDVPCDDGVICVKNENKNENPNEYICAGRTGDSFEKMCVSSGGKYTQDENSKEARCICKEVICDHGVVCSADSNGCAGHTGDSFEKMCISSGGKYDEINKRCMCNNSVCDDGVVCSNNGAECAGTTGDTFEKLCISSGGIASSNGIQCSCSGEMCAEGIVCIKSLNNTLSCADSFEKCNIKIDGKYLCRNGLIYSCEPNKDNACLKISTKTDDADICTQKGMSCNWHPISTCKEDCDNDDACRNEIDKINFCEEDGTSCSDDNDYILTCNNNKLEREYCQYGCYLNDDGKPECSEADEDSKCCGDSNNVERYDSKHNWVKVMQCKLPQKCYDSDGIAGCYECENDTTTCGTIMVNDYQHEIVQKCEEKKYNQLTDCGLNSCIPPSDNEAAHCGECKIGDTRCIPIEKDSNIGKPQTCKNGTWENDSAFCYGNASCTITKEKRDDGTEVEKSTCGICQNDVDISCVFDSKEQPPRTGYHASCKNGLFKKIDTDVCPNANSCKISKELTKCELNSCECGSGKEKDNCSRGQYCKEELLNGAIHRKCVNAMSRCEENMCICGNVVCNRGEFCTVDEELNDACVSANKCEKSECTCGENKCKTGEYCRENAICVDASEVITGTDWICGDCRNTVSDKETVTLNHCGSDTGADNCHTSALTIMDQDVISDCMNSAVFEQCIEKSFHAACDIQSCKTKASNCDKVLSQCYDKYHNRLEQFKKCGIKQETLYLAIKQSDKCEQESCDCGSQSCLKGQFCLNDMECVDGDKIDFVGILDFDKKKLSVCQCSGSECKCSCGDQKCSRRQICVGDSASTQVCEYSSSMNFTYVYKCQDKTCPNCNKEDNCCDKEGKCIDYSDTEKFVSVYEFVDSEEYVCRTLKEQCDAYLDEQTNCLEDSYSEYKVCLLNCTDSETKDKCQKACIEQRSNRDDDCLNKTLDLVKPIKDLGDIESGCFYKEESNTLCSYECRSGRRMPFNGIDACSSEL